MIVGAHTLIGSVNAGADRAFLRDVLGLPAIDAGDGWLVFGLPPSEVAIHPAAVNDTHELYLLTDDVDAFMAEMKERGVRTEPIRSETWGRVTRLTLPGGGTLGVYEPRHDRPEMPKR